MAVAPREGQVRRAYVAGGVVAVINLAVNYGLRYQRAREFARDVARVARGVDRAGRDIARVIRDNFRSGNTVSRFAVNLGPVTNTDPSAPLKRKADYSLADSVQPKKLFSMKRKGVPNVVPGGIGHYNGDFRKRKISTAESALTRHGYQSETEMYGEINSPDCQYFAVQSVNPYMVNYALAAALIRMILWRHYRISIPSVHDYINNGNTGVQSKLLRIDWYCRRKRVDGSWEQIFTVGVDIVTQITTLDQVVRDLSVKFVNDLRFGFRQLNDSWRFHGYSLQEAPPTFTTSPVYNLEEQYVSLSHLTVIQLQNVTRSNYGGGPAEVNPRGYRDDIGANPLVGHCFTLRGIYPDIEGSHAVDNISFVKQLQVTNIPQRNGIMIPFIAPANEFRGIPNPQIFSNIVKCESGLRLEPGDIKKDVLKFSFRGKLVDLISGLAYVHSPTGDPPVDLQSAYRNQRFGLCKLYAFEKVVPTGPDSVEMNYHLDRYLNVHFSENYQTVSMRKDFAQYTFDRLLTPYPDSSNARLNPVPIDQINEDEYKDGVEDVVRDILGDEAS